MMVYHLVLSSVALLFAGGRAVLGQPPEQDPNLGTFRAHVHSADMSCCKPCVPSEADNDPDVFKRP